MKIFIDDIKIIKTFLSNPVNFIIFLLLHPLIYKTKILWLLFILLIIIKIFYGFLFYKNPKPSKIIRTTNLLATINELSTQVAKLYIYFIKNSTKYSSKIFNFDTFIILSVRWTILIIFGINLKFLKIWMNFIDIFRQNIWELRFKSLSLTVKKLFPIIHKSFDKALKKEYFSFFEYI